MHKKIQEIRYDVEWIQLIKKAKSIGLTQAEVRLLISEVKNKQQYTS
jgi:DNA-binding transcriptional MerR regulator